MATYYWHPTGPRNFNAATGWSFTQGGPVGDGYPHTGDTAYFTSDNSQKCTVTGSAVCANIIFTGYVGEFAGTLDLTLTGNLTLSSGMTLSFSGPLNLAATSGNTQLITSSSKALSSAVVINSTGTTQLVDDFTCASLNCSSSGALNPNGFSLTVTALTGTNYLRTVTGSYNNFSVTGTNAKTASLAFYNSITVNGTFTTAGNSNINRLLIASYPEGIATTVIANSVTSDKTDFRDITGFGNASWNLSAAAGFTGDCGGNTMQRLGSSAFTTAATQTATGASSFTWSTHGWTTRVPLPQDDVVINNSFSASQTITADMPRLGKSINASACTGTPTLNFSVVNDVYGSINISGVTPSGTNTLTLLGRDSFTITCGGKTFLQPVYFNAQGGTYQLIDDFNGGTNNLFQIRRGTVDLNGKICTIGYFTGSTGDSLLKFNGGSIITTNGTPGAIWTGNSTMKIDLTGGGLIKFQGNAGSNSQRFDGVGLTYPNFWATGNRTGDLVINGSNTFMDFKDDGSVSHKITFETGTTQTVTSFTVVGTSTITYTIDTKTVTTTHSLKNVGGNTISCDYLNIQHCIATPSNNWYAGIHSVNHQNVATTGSGWTFNTPPTRGTTNGINNILGINSITL